MVVVLLSLRRTVLLGCHFKARQDYVGHVSSASYSIIVPYPRAPPLHPFLLFIKDHKQSLLKTTKSYSLWATAGLYIATVRPHSPSSDRIVRWWCSKRMNWIQIIAIHLVNDRRHTREIKRGKWLWLWDKLIGCISSSGRASDQAKQDEGPTK